jgi:hypothetical protein
VARFTSFGEARFEGIPAHLIFDADGPDFELALLPPQGIADCRL